MFIKQLQQFVNLLFNSKVPMVISPHIFSQIKRQFISSDAAFSSKPSFQVSPESFKAVYVTAVFIAIFSLAMFYQAMNISFRGDSRIASPSIRANDRTAFYSSANQRHQSFGFYIRHSLSPDFTPSAEYPKHRSFQSSSASLGLLSPLALAFIFPLTANVGFINFHNSAKDLRDITRHRQPHFVQSPQDTPAVNTCFNADGCTAESPQKPLQNFDPLFTTQIQGQPLRIPFVFTSGASPLCSSDGIDYFKRTFGTNFFKFHATIITDLVARLSHYPIINPKNWTTC